MARNVVASGRFVVASFNRALELFGLPARRLLPLGGVLDLEVDLPSPPCALGATALDLAFVECGGPVGVVLAHDHGVEVVVEVVNRDLWVQLRTLALPTGSTLHCLFVHSLVGVLLVVAEFHRLESGRRIVHPVAAFETNVIEMGISNHVLITLGICRWGREKTVIAHVLLNKGVVLHVLILDGDRVCKPRYFRDILAVGVEIHLFLTLEVHRISAWGIEPNGHDTGSMAGLLVELGV